MNIITVKISTLAKNLVKQVPSMKYSEALEVAAKSAGFESYRAALALPEQFENLKSACHEASARALRQAADTIELYDDATLKGDYMLDSTECAGIIQALAEREEELAKRERAKAMQAFARSKHGLKLEHEMVIVEHTLLDWAYASSLHNCDSSEYINDYQKRPYVGTVKWPGGFAGASNTTFVIEVKPQGVLDEDCLQADCLSVVVEINDGVPCVHLSNDLIGDQRLAVFSTRDGLLVRASESEVKHLHKYSVLDDNSPVTGIPAAPVMDRVFANCCAQENTVAFYEREISVNR